MKEEAGRKSSRVSRQEGEEEEDSRSRAGGRKYVWQNHVGGLKTEQLWRSRRKRRTNSNGSGDLITRSTQIL